MIGNDNRQAPVNAPVFPVAAMLVAALLSLVSAGCSKPREITNDPTYGHFSDVVGNWKTKIPLSVRELDKRMYLVDTNAFMQRSRELAVIPAGAEVRIDRLILWPSWECDVVEIHGHLVTGLYADKVLALDPVLLAGNRWFRGPYTNTNWTIDQNMLEKP